MRHIVIRSDKELAVIDWAKKYSNQLYQRTSEIYLIEGGYKNLVFYYFNNDRKYILRVKEDDSSNISHLNDEIQYINHLKSNQISVCVPILSMQNKYIEKMNIKGSTFYISAFEFAEGKKINYQEYLGNKSIYSKFGKITGMIHQVSKNFISESTDKKTIKDNEYIINFLKYVPVDYYHIYELLIKLTNEIEALDKPNHLFGLIHGDINVGNCHIHKDQLIIFDFDECHYSWYIEDVAIQLFYTLYVFGDSDIEERNREAKLFLTNFIEEYTQYRNIDECEWKHFPLFLKLREIIVLIGIFKRWDFDQLNQWQSDYFKDTLFRITNQIPIYDINDFIKG